MQILHKRPPNWDAILKVFDVDGKDVCFCYGQVIFVPTGFKLSTWLIAHESVHAGQQAVIGVEGWWERYLADPKFRLDQEIPAHIAEYQSFCQVYAATMQRKYRRMMLHNVASRLAGPLYNRMMRYEDARRVIKQALAA